MMRIVLFFAFSCSVMAGCVTSGSDPYEFKDDASGLSMTFPQYPYTQAYQDTPHYRRLVELHQDSAAFFLSIICRPDQPAEQLSQGSRLELGFQMEQQGFEQAMSRDTTLLGMPVYEAYYRDDMHLLHHYIIVHDSFVIHPSVLMLDPGQLTKATAFFESLQFENQAHD